MKNGLHLDGGLWRLRFDAQQQDGPPRKMQLDLGDAARMTEAEAEQAASDVLRQIAETIFPDARAEGATVVYALGEVPVFRPEYPRAWHICAALRDIIDTTEDPGPMPTSERDMADYVERGSAARFHALEEARAGIEHAERSLATPDAPAHAEFAALSLSRVRELIASALRLEADHAQRQRGAAAADAARQRWADTVNTETIVARIAREAYRDRTRPYPSSSAAAAAIFEAVNGVLEVEERAPVTMRTVRRYVPPDVIEKK